MFKNFKGSHPLQFVFGTPPKPQTLGGAQIGDVFTRHGAVCMRVQERRPQTVALSDHIDIINLQTGAVWSASKDDEIQMVSATIAIAQPN